MEVIKTISVREKVDLLGRLLFYVPYVLTKETIKTTAVAIQRGLPLKEFLVATLIRILMTCFTPRQLLYINGTTGQTYQAWIEREAETRGMFPKQDTIRLPDGTSLHWIRKSENKASKVVLFFHGGGYFAPMAPEHLNLCASIVNTCETTKSVAVAVLEYDLSSQSQYPRQLQQASLALGHFLQLGYQPKDIFIGGDSAGGHLTLGLLSHLMHKHPSLPSLSLGDPLAGVFLISPWVSDDTSTLSFNQNSWVDMLPRHISPNAAAWLISSHIQQAESESKQGWAIPSNADKEWWSTLAEIVTDVYITVGEQEMFRDHVIIFANMLREQAPRCKVDFELGEAEAHDHMLVWEMLHARRNPALERLLKWFGTILKERDSSALVGS
ncbi:hypothetical protein QM012_002546 [Aureobasidium pullulans]|uniref:Alpha/beta hydrolase fold-3 domain-containing protein n=1 Tax=Aureobasidium pullulans TaxID=5580 RepID=A0ABR0T9V9_AURPU